AAARAASSALGAARGGQALVLESAEPEFSFDRDGHVESITPVIQTESHVLIERLMVAANEQVAEFLDARKLATLYRIHERPEPSSVEHMLAQLASLGVPTPTVPKGALSPQQAADIAGETSGMVADWVRRHDGRGATALNRIVLRALKQAAYEPENRGHSGLALHSYCHFTSPIRRYPDLICHRALLSAVGGDEPAPEASFVAAAGPDCSAREREAMVIERDADDIARAFLLERRLFEVASKATETPTFEGEIVGVIGAGAFVNFGPYEGMLRVRQLRDDWYDLNEEGTALIGERGGAYRLGDRVEVAVASIDAPRGRVDLVLGSSDGQGQT
ncbi:MAG: RNB domain-containing ribonuclease, partial [Solirubrobacterales bacterium]|nr:RNB domain-containing ribonuclease [Solirubrobacterales bacterium]